MDIELLIKDKQLPGVRGPPIEMAWGYLEDCALLCQLAVDKLMSMQFMLSTWFLHWVPAPLDTRKWR